VGVGARNHAGDVVANEDMRISLGNFGGSFWFRMATDGSDVCTPAGNGAGASMDKYAAIIRLATLHLLTFIWRAEQVFVFDWH
jgi:hypothetical protein